MTTPSPWPRDVWLDAMWESEAVKPNERVVAYAYARYAGADDLAWCSWDELRKRTGIRSRDAVNRAVSGLVADGWLVEVEKARQHYSTRYRLTVPKSQQSVSRTPQQSVRRTPEAPSSPSNGSSSPFPETSSPFPGPDLSNGSFQRRTPTSSSPTSLAQLATDASATEEEINLLIQNINTTRPDIRSPLAYLRKCQQQGDLAELLAAVRDEHQRTVLADELAEARRGPECIHGREGGQHLRSDTGRRLCPQCQANTERNTA